MTIRSATIKLRGDTTQAVASMKRAEAATKRFGAAASSAEKRTLGMNRAMVTARAGAKKLTSDISGKLGLAGGALAAVYALDQLADRAVEVNNVHKTLKINIDKARDAVTGQVDSLTLAKNANKLHLAGLKLTENQYAALTGVVAKAADATGEDLEQALQKTTRAITKGNTQALAGLLGLSLDNMTAQREFAESLGKTTEELTLAEKQQIALNLVLTDGVKQTDDMGAATANAAVRWVQLKNAVTDAMDNIVTIDQHIGDLVMTIKQGVEGALMDLGVSAENVQKIFGVFEAEQRAMWALITGDIRRAKVELLGLIGAQNTLEAVRLRAQDIKLREEERAKQAADNAQAEVLRLNKEREQQDSALAQQMGFESVDAAMMMGPAPPPEKKNRTGGGRGRRKPPSIPEETPIEDLLTPDRRELDQGAMDSLLAEWEAEEKAKEERMAEIAEREREAHAERMRLLEEHIEAERRRKQAIMDTADASIGAADTMNGAMQNVATAAGMNSKRQETMARVTEGGILLAKAISHQVQAAMAFASFNVPLGIGHQAAAAAGFANASIMLAGGLPGKGAGGGGGRGGGVGAGGGIRLPQGGANGADSDVPISTDRDRQRGGVPSGPANGANSVVINMHGIATNDAEVGRGVARALRTWEQTGGGY